MSIGWERDPCLRQVFEGLRPGIVGWEIDKRTLSKKRAASLGLTSARPYLILQVYLPVGRPFTCEVVISDDKLTRRRLIFSTAFKEELYGELHAQISLQNLERGKWLNLCINMLSLMDICFEHDGKTNFRVVDAITVNSVCKLRNVYVVRDNPHGKGGYPLKLPSPTASTPLMSYATINM